MGVVVPILFINFRNFLDIYESYNNNYECEIKREIIPVVIAM